jgi:peptide/nickel transport system permease protein
VGTAAGPVFWRELRRHRLAVVSLGVVLVLSLACAAAPLIAPYAFDAIDLSSIRQGPSLDHPMGTDDLGRDLFTRVLYGGRVSILIGFLSALLGTGIGAAVGALAGYYGRFVDNLLMRAAGSMAVIIGLLSWMTTARVVRSEVLTIREMAYVEAARSLGARNARIIGRHVLPNALGPILVGATLAVGNAIIIESSLSFLGLGVQPPTPTWGNMLMDAQATMATKPWLTVFPGLAILLMVLAVNFIGDGLQDALDPGARSSE